jgi:hypothetical protein
MNKTRKTWTIARVCRWMVVGTLVGVVSLACSNNTLVTASPDAQPVTPGSLSPDGGFGFMPSDGGLRPGPGGGGVGGGACGAAGQPCCRGECQAGLACDNPPGPNTPGMCVNTCGGVGQACCGGENCQASFACVGGMMGTGGNCQACGGADQPCCNGAGNTCQMGLRCIIGATGDKCGTCGGAGQPCCGRNGGGSCAMGLGCAGRAMGNAGMCTTCGGAGQPCCEGGGGATACQMGLGCVNSPTGATCGMCGGAGQPCCNGTQCTTPGMGCVGRGMGNPGMCAACGGTGQPCCGGGGCGAGNRCVMAKCTTCGGRGQVCCPGGGLSACQAGLNCNPSMMMGVPGSCGDRPDGGGTPGRDAAAGG